MAGKISELTELAEPPHLNDELEVLDKSDTTFAAEGTNKRVKSSFLRGQLGTRSLLSISSGAITITGKYHTFQPAGLGVDTELSTINGGTEGDLLVLTWTGNYDQPTVKHDVGNIKCSGGFDRLFQYSAMSHALLVFDGTYWQMLSFSENYQPA